MGSYLPPGIPSEDVHINGLFAEGYLIVPDDGSALHVTDVPAIGFYGATPQNRPVVAGSRGANAALASLLTALGALGLVQDSTSA